jgi:hypothetical protein
MKRPHCDRCGRVTYDNLRALPAGRVKPAQWLSSCSDGPECALVAQGRQIGLKEAMTATSGAFTVDYVRASIRKAMKAGAR